MRIPGQSYSVREALQYCTIVTYTTTTCRCISFAFCEYSVGIMTDGGGSTGTPSMADIGNLLQQLVSEQQLQRSRVEELAQQVAQTQQGVAGTQVVTEHVVGEVVQQVQLAFSKQLQTTTILRLSVRPQWKQHQQQTTMLKSLK